MPLQALCIPCTGNRHYGYPTSLLVQKLQCPPRKCNAFIKIRRPFSDIFHTLSPEHLISDSAKNYKGRAGLKRGTCRGKNREGDLQEWEKFVELPIVPLPLVLFPGAILPLQIFEFRYRIMVHTLLQTDLRFGIVYSDNGTNGAVDVGCVGQVIKHEKLADDRFFLVCKGQERFRIVNLVQTRPYPVAEVQWLEDVPSSSLIGDDDLEVLALEVETYMRDVVRISNRLSGKPDHEIKDLRGDLFPTPFSFLVGSTFEGAPREQQALLELDDTAMRLEREKETLRNTLHYLAAASAVKDVFQPKIDQRD